MSFVQKSYPEYPRGPIPQSLLDAIASRSEQSTPTTYTLLNPHENKFPWPETLRSSTALDPSLYFHYVQQQLAGECSQNVPAKYTALQAQAKESETKLAQISCWPAFTRKNGVDLNSGGYTVQKLDKAKALAKLRVVELEFLKATIARTTEELGVLQSQMTVAESRIKSSADDLVRVAESYIPPSCSPQLDDTLMDIETELKNNVALTTCFFKNYLYPPSVAPTPGSPV